MLYKDQLDNSVEIKHTPKRIISLVPSQTELLVDLGLIDSIVGVTKFCVHPKNLRKQKTVVGGTKQVSIEKIRALQPDLIIANKEENTQEMVLALRDVCPVWVSDVNTLDDNYALIYTVGKICKVQEKATQLLEQIRQKQRDFEQKMLEVITQAAVYLIWNSPQMGAGSPSFIDQMLRLNKFENLLKDQDSRYPEVKNEQLKEAQFVLLSSEPFPFDETHKIQMQAQTKTQVVLVDGEYFSWYGSRLLKAFDYFEDLQRTLGRLS